MLRAECGIATASRPFVFLSWRWGIVITYM